MLLLEFLGKEPSNLKEWKNDVTQLNVAMALLQKRLTVAVQDGVLLALGKAFGK